MAAWLPAQSFASRTSATPHTPIHHLVVIFQENVSFDHYFATYPTAENRPGEHPFIGKKDTPSVNGLGPLLDHNPNSAKPMRLSPGQAATCDQEHEYPAEQKAVDGGLMDRFVESTGASYGGCDPKLVLDYFDGNTVGALWRYAQSFAMSDNFFGTTFGPSTPGALNLVSGQTHGAVPEELKDGADALISQGTVVGDADPTLDDCSSGPTFEMKGRNIGDLLNAAGVRWGWFQGGFRPTSRSDAGKALCGTSHISSERKPKNDYVPHHEPFQYFRSTANPHHLPPSSIDQIGEADQANHQYDLEDFWTAVKRHALPSVSFLKAPAYQNGHAGYSDPINEQKFLVETINRLQTRPEWKEMAIVITYDDSDGWYDHVMPPIVNGSNDAKLDALNGPGACGKTRAGAYSGRCGYGPRLPLLILSPFAKRNYVDHAIIDQTSIIRFIEDNWSLGRLGNQSFDEMAGSLEGLFDFGAARARPLILDPATGLPR